MKSIIKSLTYAVLTAAVISCQAQLVEEEIEIPSEVNEPSEEMILQTFTATTGDVTKTTMDGSGNTVWVTDDQIKVYCTDGSSSNVTLSDGAGTKTGVFSGMVPAGKTGAYAVYPASVTSSVDIANCKVTVTVPNEQTLDEATGGFTIGNIATSIVDAGNKLKFQNVNAFLSVTVSAAVTKVVVESIDGTALASGVDVTYPADPADPITYSNSGTEYSSITLLLPGVAGTYYFSVVPGTHTKGLKFTYYTGSYTETGTYYLNKSLEIERNDNWQFGAFEPTKDYYVKASGSGGNGLSWSSALTPTQMWNMITLAAAGSDDDKKVALFDAIDGATFHLGAGDYNFGAAASLAVSEASTLNLTFKGGYPADGGARDVENNATIFTGDDDANGTGDHRILSLGGNMNVTFDGIIFEKGIVDGDGGGVKISSGDWVFRDCSFSNNSALNGGAIYIDGGTIALNGCTLSSNTATTTVDQFGGGAIFMRGGSEVTIEDSDFTSNSTTSCGGAISAWPDDGDPDTDDDDANSNSLIISNNCEFSANHASKWAGAILYKVKGSMTVSDSSFSENYADEDGGAIEADNSNATFSFTSVSFTGNHADGDNGGAMWASDGTYTLTNCNFVGNYSSPNSKDNNKGGGAIYLEKGNMTITGGVFGGDNVAEGNTTTGGDGGAICLNNASIGLYLDDVSFKNNSASRVKVSSKYYHGYGGALYLASTKNSDWNSHKATFIKNCIFESCNAYYGGAISTHTGSLGFVRISGGSFTDCSSTDMGGAIYIRSSGGDSKKFEFVDNNNIGTVFQGNHSSNNNGGAVAIDEASTVNVFRASFNGNYAKSGGAIYAKSTGNKLFIDESSFDANYITASYGCVMNIQNNYFVMHNSSVRGSYASPSQTNENGSWIDFDGIQGCTSISNCSIIGDAASSALVWACTGSWTNYFTNNIITSSSSTTKSIYSDGSPLDMSYNHYYSCDYESGTTITNDNGVSECLSGSIDGLEWSNTDNSSYYWKWNGTFNSSTPDKTNKTDVIDRVNNACPAFIDWSDTDFVMDQRRVSRGNGDWWPGAYQN